MSKTILIFAGCGFYGLACLLLYLHRGQEQARLQHEIQAQREIANEVAHLRTQLADTPPAAPDATTLARLREENRKLIRLRGEVAGLRQIALTDIDEMMAELDSVQDQMQAATNEGNLHKARREAQNKSKQIIRLFTNLYGLLAIAAKDTYPDSWHTLERNLAADTAPGFGRERLDELSQSQLLSGPVPSEVEFLNPSNATYEGPEVFLIRERTPRPLPDGGWARIYATSKGRRIELTAPDGDFEQAEKSFLTGQNE